MDERTKKCEHDGCDNMILPRYRFCWEHRKDTYYDDCRFHGSTLFREGKCIKCYNMKRVTYRVNRSSDGKSFMIGSHRAKEDHPMYRYFKWLVHRNRKYAMQFVGKVVDGPGTYGIFIRNKRATASLYLGKCMYVGQSVHVKTRVSVHQSKVLLAEKALKIGYKEGKTLEEIKREHPDNLPNMYFDLADIGYDNLKFVKLMGIPKPLYSKMDKKEAFTALTILEQYGMDCFEPELNVTAARRTDLQIDVGEK